MTAKVKKGKAPKKPAGPVDWKKRLQTFFMLAVATGLFSGLFPIAPGTWGSLVGLGIIWIFRDSYLVFHVILCLFLLGLGVWAADRAQRYYKKADSGHIVIDEIVGIMVTMIGIPLTGYWLVCGFILFRFFDVVKPPPANFFDSRVKSGWGVMMDDVCAGVYGNIILHLMVRATI